MFDPILKNLESDHFISEVRDAVIQLKNRFERIIIFATGGSSMVGQALCHLKPDSSIIFLDNIDPQKYSQVVHTKDTGFVVISKSGKTMETLAQISCAMNISPKLTHDQVIVVTQTDHNPLHKMAQENNWCVLEHPLDIGGRFSAFSVVGVVPCILLGLNPIAFRDGARSCVQAPDVSDILDKYNQGVKTHVLWIYSDFCDGLMQWWRQLVAESLGKKDSNGQKFGITPIVGKGTTDEHSQLQLYLDGCCEKIYTVIKFRNKGLIVGKELHNIFDAHAKAVSQVLKEKGFLVRDVSYDMIDEYTMGHMMMRFMREVVEIAKHFDINAFDQPAVELVKVEAKAYLC